MTNKETSKKRYREARYRAVLSFFAEQEPGTPFTPRQVQALVYPDTDISKVKAFLQSARDYLRNSGSDAQIIAEPIIQDGNVLKGKQYRLEGELVLDDRPVPMTPVTTSQEYEMFQAYYGELYEKVVVAQIRKGNSREKAEDAAQYAFMQVYRSPKLSTMLADKTYLLSTLYRAAGNFLIDQWRKREKEVSMEDGKEYRITEPKSVEEEVIGKDISLLLKKALEGMKPEDKDLIYMRAIEERSYEELAPLFGLSESALRVRFFRLRRSLQDRLGPLNDLI